MYILCFIYFNDLGRNTIYFLYCQTRSHSKKHVYVVNQPNKKRCKNLADYNLSNDKFMYVHTITLRFYVRDLMKIGCGRESYVTLRYISV